MKITAADTITFSRIVLSIALLFCTAMSPVFYILYSVAGLSDMTDGAVARKTNTVSTFGAKLDSIADLVFVAVCLIKLLPLLVVPVWLWIWIAIIAFIRSVNIIYSIAFRKSPTTMHSVMNKVTGALLFSLPFMLSFIDLKYSAIAVCTAATVAAIQEGYIIRGTNLFFEERR